MPQSISAPLPHTAAGPNAREHTRAARQSWSAQPIESRVSALEARWEETVPTLATRSDMRGELRGVENRLIIWILGAAFTLLFAMLGIFFAGYNSVNERFDSINERFGSVNARIDSVAAELRAEIRETNARIDSRFDALMSELRSQRNDSR